MSQGLETFDGDSESFLKRTNTQIPALDYAIPHELLVSTLGIEIVKDELLRIENGIRA